MMPRSRIDAASSSSSASEKFRRGLRGLGRRNSIGTRRWLRVRSIAADSSPTSPISAASPRPSRDLAASSAIALSRERGPDAVPDQSAFVNAELGRPQRFLALDDLRGEAQVGLAAEALEIVE